MQIAGAAYDIVDSNLDGSPDMYLLYIGKDDTQPIQPETRLKAMLDRAFEQIVADGADYLRFWEESDKVSSVAAPKVDRVVTANP